MISLTGNDLSIDEVVAVAREGELLAELKPDILVRLDQSHSWVARAVESKTVIYGVTTGFGPLATTTIDPAQARKLSRNLVLSCLAGVGQPLREDIVRAMMLVRLNSLLRGNSGIRPVLANTLREMINRKITPYIPSKGSLGASGDLTPLAHMAIVLCRDEGDETGGFSGKAWYGGELMSGAQAMENAGLDRLVLDAKEGLALTNGTTFMASAGSLGIYDAENILRNAEIASALSLEAHQGLTAGLHPDLHAANNQPGQIRSAARIRHLLENSALVDSALNKVQDAYSLRCIPQVLGPIWDSLDFLRERFSASINSSSDNPLIFLNPSAGNSGVAISGGNFHGAGPAMWLDFLGIAIAEAGSMAERRIFRTLDPSLNNGLPPMLVANSGLNSGLMIPQYIAAALVSDNKTLAHPDSVDSIPSAANQEDYVSMGANAARHALEIIDNVQHIIAIELITAAQAVDLRENGPRRLGRGTRIAYELIRSKVAFMDTDRETSSDIESIVNLIKSENLIQNIQFDIEHPGHNSA